MIHYFIWPAAGRDPNDRLAISEFSKTCARAVSVTFKSQGPPRFFLGAGVAMPWHPRSWRIADETFRVLVGGTKYFRILALSVGIA
jgi:hypothetical protein